MLPPTPRSQPLLQDLIRILPYTSLAQRKDIMTALRVGSIPRHNIRLRKKFGGRYRDKFIAVPSAHDTTTYVSWDQFWEFTIAPLVRSPVRRSILSVYLRTMELENDDEGRMAVQDAVVKEIQATQEERPAILQYPFFYSRQDCLDHKMHPDLPYRPVTMLWMRHKLLQFKKDLRDILLVPQCGFKTVGIDSCYELEKSLYPHLPDFQRPNRRNYTTADLEAYWSETGNQVEGVCEVRYAWKFNDLKPRVYYSIGASAFYAARYVHSIFDRLQKVFRSSDPRRRYTFIQFPFIDFDQEIFAIYDYASFTSKLADFRRFISELARFLDVRCWIFDTAVGMRRDNVQDILERYNSVCNTEGHFSIQRVIGGPKDDVTKVIVLHHMVAGMLGVFGNITGSTSLHGMVGIASTGDERRINTIGDDAAGVWRKDEFEDYQIIEAVRSIGEIAEEKFEIWDTDQKDQEEHDSWHYTKRPIGVDHGIVTNSSMPEFPMIGQAMHHFPRHITLIRGTLHSRRAMFVKQTCRFMTNIATRELDDEDVEMVLSILRKCYQMLSLPARGSLPMKYAKPCDGVYPMELLCVPRLSVESIREGWWTVLRRDVNMTGIINLPVVVGEDELPMAFTRGVSFIHRAEKVVNVLVKIGKVRCEGLFEDRMITDETLAILDDILLGKRTRLYRYTVVEDCDQWYSYREWRA